MPSLPYPIGTSVKVFRDHVAWDSHAKWFMLPSPLLRELYVASYDLAADEEGDYSGNWQADSEFLQSSHPGCVFIY